MKLFATVSRFLHYVKQRGKGEGRAPEEGHQSAFEPTLVRLTYVRLCWWGGIIVCVSCIGTYK